MKPLIWWEMHSWNCCLDWSDFDAVWGFGCTPTEAYNDWVRKTTGRA